MFRCLATIVVVVTLSGCAGFTTLSSPEAAASLDNLSLCKRARSNLCGGIYGCPQDKIAIAEIRKRNLIPDSEWPLIQARKIRLGMTECGLNASWGGHPRINVSTGSWGTHKQYVYDNGSYVYVENGKVTSWQN